MASIAHSLSGPLWKCLAVWFTAFAEAAEIDSAAFVEQRIQSLERRITDLERAQAAGLAMNGEA
ncbi:MAG: hypothetical protein ACKVOL_10600 [Novosphingobium sp.]